MIRALRTGARPPFIWSAVTGLPGRADLARGGQEWRWLAVLFAAILLAPGAAAAAPLEKTFTNPVLPSGADPWVTEYKGVYYYTQTMGDRLQLWKTHDLTELSTAPSKVIWRPPASGPGSASIWAPELHRIGHAWYMYYTGSDKGHNDDVHRRIYVLENPSEDPFSGDWVEKGALETHYNGIDATVFIFRGRLYFVYSAYVRDHSDLVIAPMPNPWTLSDQQVDIASPDRPWELLGGRKILEGPEFLQGPTGRIFLTYSASACWADEYSLGLLSADPDANLLDPHTWTKSALPVFKSSPEHNVYAPGHNGFFVSPDGSENWIVYHANVGPGQKCSHRSPRIQRFTWTADGAPDFGAPVAAGVPIQAPAGTGR